MLEFSIVMLVAIPLFFGTVSMGISIGRGLEALQVTRDACHMYSLGVDMSSTGDQSMIATMAPGFKLTSTGNAVLIFSQIITLYQADCTAASVSPCSNVGKQVVVQRIVVGNSSLRTSSYASPSSSIIGSQGNIAPADYMKKSSAVVTGFPASINQGDGDVAYITEGYFTTPDLNFLSPGFSSAKTTGGIYVQFLF